MVAGHAKRQGSTSPLDAPKVHPAEARGEDGAWRLRLRARHHVQVPKTRVTRASDEEAVALLRACRSARDRLLVLCRAGLRRSEAVGLRREDIHFLPDSRVWDAISPARTCTWSDVTTSTGHGRSRGIRARADGIADRLADYLHATGRDQAQPPNWAGYNMNLLIDQVSFIAHSLRAHRRKPLQ